MLKFDRSGPGRCMTLPARILGSHRSGLRKLGWSARRAGSATLTPPDVFRRIDGVPFRTSVLTTHHETVYTVEESCFPTDSSGATRVV